MFRSIRWRIAIPFVILILVVITSLGIYSTNFIRKNYLSSLENSMLSQANILADRVPDLLSCMESSNDLKLSIDRWADIIDMRVTLILTDGTVLADSNEEVSLMDNHLDRVEIADALSTGAGRSMRFSRTIGYEMHYVAVEVQGDNQLLGVLRLALPLTEVEQGLDELQQVWFIVTFLVSCAAAFLAALISIQISKPIRLLTQQVTDLAKLESDLGFPRTMRKNEIELLIQAFNSMSMNIQQKINTLEAETGKLNAILNGMNDGVLIVDAEGKIQLVNLAARKMFGVDLTQPERIKLVEVTRLHNVIDLWEKCLATGQEQINTFEVLKTRRFLQCVAAPSSQSLPGLILMLFHDITQQREIETTRKEFVSNVSHELRNPLAVIKLLTETLQEGALNKPSKAHHFLNQIQNEVDSLSLMVGELLELSLVESGRLSLNLIPVYPRDIIIQACERLNLQAQKTGIKIKTQCEDDLPTMQADEPRIVQVLVNLIHNAIKFSSPESEIVVSVEKQGLFMNFCVEDQGIGISQSDQAHIFERFYKVDRSRRSSGTGLGLSIARHFVEAHGGKIWVESKLSKGSLFFFSIPFINN